MTATSIAPDRRSPFSGIMNAVLSDHAVLRHLAVAAAERPGFSADNVLSLADALTAHEHAEARLFAHPFLSRPPKTVASTAARARRRCLEYTSGNSPLPDPSAAAALFVDALLAHLAAEEAWLELEQEHQNERLLIHS
jgi:hypothetical protein